MRNWACTDLSFLVLHVPVTPASVRYTSPPVYQLLEKVTKKSLRKNTSIPVISISVTVITTLPLLMSVPFESTPLAAVVDVSSPLAAVVYESSPQAAVIFIGPHSSQLPGVELGPKDHYYTAW